MAKYTPIAIQVPEPLRPIPDTTVTDVPYQYETQFPPSTRLIPQQDNEFDPGVTTVPENSFNAPPLVTSFALHNLPPEVRDSNYASQFNNFLTEWIAGRGQGINFDSVPAIFLASSSNPSPSFSGLTPAEVWYELPCSFVQQFGESSSEVAPATLPGISSNLSQSFAGLTQAEEKYESSFSFLQSTPNVPQFRENSSELAPATLREISSNRSLSFSSPILGNSVAEVRYDSPCSFVPQFGENSSEVAPAMLPRISSNPSPSFAGFTSAVVLYESSSSFLQSTLTVPQLGDYEVAPAILPRISSNPLLSFATPAEELYESPCSFLQSTPTVPQFRDSEVAPAMLPGISSHPSPSFATPAEELYESPRSFLQSTPTVPPQFRGNSSELALATLPVISSNPSLSFSSPILGNSVAAVAGQFETLHFSRSIPWTVHQENVFDVAPMTSAAISSDLCMAAEDRYVYDPNLYRNPRVEDSSVNPPERRVTAGVSRNTARSEQSETQRKKPTPWTREEHNLFLVGLQQYGKGNWRNIARRSVVTKTPSQVASHAQKYFLRQQLPPAERRRPSIHDINTVDNNLMPPSTAAESQHYQYPPPPPPPPPTGGAAAF